MKKQTIEPEFIGGQGRLTKEEEASLSAYFAKKKKRRLKRSKLLLTVPKQNPKQSQV